MTVSPTAKPAGSAPACLSRLAQLCACRCRYTLTWWVVPLAGGHGVACPPLLATPQCSPPSHRRDCHLADAPSSSLLKHLLKGEWGAAEWQNSRRWLSPPDATKGSPAASRSTPPQPASHSARDHEGHMLPATATMVMQRASCRRSTVRPDGSSAGIAGVGRCSYSVRPYLVLTSRSESRQS